MTHTDSETFVHVNIPSPGGSRRERRRNPPHHRTGARRRTDGCRLRCKLARLDGATYPTALTRAAVTFAAVVTFAATVAGTFATLLI